MEKNKEGKYQLEAKTYSPEYSKGYAFNTNYDLSILRWGLKTLIEMDNKKEEKITPPSVAGHITKNPYSFPDE